MKVARIKHIFQSEGTFYSCVEIIFAQNNLCKYKLIPISLQSFPESGIHQSRYQFEDYQRNFNDSTITQEQTVLSEEKLEVMNFLKTTKTNIYKNIIYAFQRHIEDLQDERLRSLYQSMSEDNWNFQNIQARILKNLKGCKRYGLKMKNITSNKNLKKIFIHFLQNIKALWLESSKIKNKQMFEEHVALLLKANDFGMLSTNISFYNKHRK